uniref:YCII-related domain-containing protein n=1 Tax=Mycena chlorophos TaxID=658473 RepID=A0ABQ0LCV0_MYCCL|nr:predicted protein [Mycena chlorophos]
MSTSVRPRFLVYAPDHTDKDAFSRRMSVRATHLDVAKQNIANGKFLVAGALLTPESLHSEEKKMVGSSFIVEAETLEEVKEIMEKDIYYTSGVWDPEKLVILPFVAATPFP